MKLLRRPCVVSGRGLWAVIILMFGGLSSAREASAPNTNPSPRPHIIFIVADDLGWDDVSFHGSKQIPTPNIDHLAYDGIILNNYYVSPICTPTRSAIMTGRHPIHTGLQHNVIVGSQPYGLPLNETIMPQYFNKLGYTSRMVGKWHLGFLSKEYTPTYRGFQSHFGYWLGAEDYFDHTAEATRDFWGFDFRRDMEVARNATGQYSTELFGQEAVNIINTHDTSKPLLLYLPFQAVHSGNGDEEPLEAPQKYINRFPHITNLKRKVFAGMVSALDDAVGNVTAALVRTGMLENSIIVFTTDNGGPSNGFDFNAASNWPLRGVKDTLWEGGVRGVGFVSSPLLKTSSYVSNNLFHVCDWLPTLYSAAGGNVSVFPRLDGYPMWDMLSARDAPVRTEVLHNIDPIRDIASLRIGDYKLVMGQTYGGRWSGWYPPWSSDLDENSLKFAPKESDDVLRFVPGTGLNYDLEQSDNVPVVVKCGTKPKNASTNCEPTKAPCLYHIPSDPCEYINLANEQPALVSHFVHRLIEYNNTAVPPLNGHMGQDPAGNPKLHGGVWDPWRP